MLFFNVDHDEDVEDDEECFFFFPVAMGGGVERKMWLEKLSWLWRILERVVWRGAMLLPP